MDASHAAAQSPLHITTQRLHVTSEDNFWTALLQVLIIHYMISNMCVYIAGAGLMHDLCTTEAADLMRCGCHHMPE